MKRFAKCTFIRYLAVALVATASALFCQSCFTGIESTSKVKLSRQDRKLIKPSDEEALLRSVRSEQLGGWRPGKRFVAADRRLCSVMRHISGPTDTLASDTLQFVSVASVPSPSGVPVARITFTDGSSEWEYDPHSSFSDANTGIVANRLPLLIDLDYVAKVESLLVGRTLYTVSPDWFSLSGERRRGRKYIPVKVTAVKAGNLQFPLRVIFDDGRDLSEMLMNDGSRATDSRPFQALFSIQDPRRLHKSISDEVWQLICEGRVRPGMTKEECRLALGNPSMVDSGHDYSRIIDIWNYGDGATLRFEDGVLTESR